MSKGAETYWRDQAAVAKMHACTASWFTALSGSSAAQGVQGSEQLATAASIVLSVKVWGSEQPTTAASMVLSVKVWGLERPATAASKDPSVRLLLHMHASAGAVLQGEIAWMEEAVQACLQCQLRPYTLLWSHLGRTCMGKGAETGVGGHAAGAN